MAAVPLSSSTRLALVAGTGLALAAAVAYHQASKRSERAGAAVATGVTEPHTAASLTAAGTAASVIAPAAAAKAAIAVSSAPAAAAAAAAHAQLSSDVVNAINQWIKWDPNPISRKKMSEALLGATTASAVAALSTAFSPRIAFGTAGLRARMAPGYANINELVVIQTTQGLAKYLLSEAKTPAEEAELKARGVVLGYDGRHNSNIYAELVAAVLLSIGIKVYLFIIPSEFACTPIVPYTLLQKKAAAGIMVTASHNPKDDNGYKVYWANGAQIIPPHDAGIAASILANLEPWVPLYTLDKAHPLLVTDLQSMIDGYMRAIIPLSFHRHENADAKLRVTFTAMHGVGAWWTKQAFEAFNLPAYIPVPEQIRPDPEFPTVAFPNPEEGKGALALAMKAADAAGSPIILANDPDADRLAVAERDEKGQWDCLSGNEIALLLADWVWTNFRKQNPDLKPEDAKKCVMLASSVSSQVLGAMAKKEGFTFIPTLTGFKWMGNVAADQIALGNQVLFAFEVEIGFMVGSMSLDKDGVRTAAIFYEMSNQIYARGSTLKKHLDVLYQRYGYFTMTTKYFFCYDPAKMAKIFERVRKLGRDGSYPEAAGEFKIVSVRDVTNGRDTGEADGKARLPQTPDAQMITFRFANGATSTLRGSGTEPKLKYYVECCESTLKASRALTDQVTAAVIREFLQPELNGLEPPKQ